MNTRAEELHAQASAFHAEHPEVWRLFERRALDLIAAGQKRFSARDLFGLIRWELAMARSGDFKINNNFAALYARRFETHHPKHEGFFEKRERPSERRAA